LPKLSQTGRFCITSYLQLRESDLYGRGRIAQLSFFFLRRSFFVRRGERMRWTGQIFWLLALFRQPPESPSSRLHPRNFFRGLAQWEVVSSYSSATAPDSHGISCADPLFQARKELEARTSRLRFERQDYLIRRAYGHVERSRDIP